MHAHSLQAYRAITEDRKLQEQMLLEAYNSFGAMSDREACYRLQWEAPSVVSARRNGLMKRGLVKELGEKTAETGKRVSVWGRANTYQLEI